MGRRTRGEAEEGREPVVDTALAEELVAGAREQGVELLGENGLLRQMTEAVLERAGDRRADRACGVRAA